MASKAKARLKDLLEAIMRDGGSYRNAYGFGEAVLFAKNTVLRMGAREGASAKEREEAAGKLSRQAQEIEELIAALKKLDNEVAAKREIMTARGVQFGDLLNRYNRLHTAVVKHHDQKADDRCWMDDDELYAAAGLPPVDRRVGDQEEMLKNCKRFIPLRTEGGGWPSYIQLEKWIIDLRRAINTAIAECRLCGGQGSRPVQAYDSASGELEDAGRMKCVDCEPLRAALEATKDVRLIPPC
jgi:hypothetical protein